MTVVVRWPAKNSGAFVFGLNFWFFGSSQKNIEKDDFSHKFCSLFFFP